MFLKNNNRPVLVFILLLVILILILYILFQERKYNEEMFRYNEVDQSVELENTFMNGTDQNKFSICDQWSKNNYRNSKMNITLNNNKLIELRSTGKTNNFLKENCPIILNQKMLNDLQKNVLQPHNCTYDYNGRNDIYVYDSINNKEVCYTGPSQPYYRNYFDHWIEPVGDGCSVRDNILYENADINVMTNEKIIIYKTGACSPASGSWFVYQDEFKKEFNNPLDLQVDHTVALKNTWNSGAYKWKPWQLRAYANDATPGHLELMKSDANGSKGDEPINTWTPSKYYVNTNKSVDCQYAADYAAVKHRWNLKLTDKEYDKLNTILIKGKCKEIPKAEIDYIGKSLNESYTEPEKIEIFGNNNNLYNQLNNIKNDTDNYIYCKTIDKNTKILSTKNRKLVLSNLKNRIENNPKQFGIKNLDYFDKIKDSLGKIKVCNILYK